MLFLAFQFGVTNFAAAAGIIVAALLLLALRNDWRNFQAIAGVVNGDESEVCGGDVLGSVGNIVFDEDFHAHLHRGAKDTVDGGTQNHQVSDANRDEEINVIDGSGNDVAASVTVSSHGSGKIDPVHETAAEQGAERVGIVG